MTGATWARPQALSEALALLEQGGWTVLAGGTDLLAAQAGRGRTGPLLDITGIAALRGIVREDGGWRFGATTTWSDVVRAGLPPQFDALVRAAKDIGGEQIQNTATIAGNLCNASPAADGAPVWLALDANVELSSERGAREMPVGEFLVASRRTGLLPGEVMTAVRVPAANARSTFMKLGARRYLVISICMVAAVLELDDDGRVGEARIAVGACTATAQRLGALEKRLRGMRLTPALANIPAPADFAGLTPIDDVRASGAYRLHAALTITSRALAELGSPPSRVAGAVT